MQNEGTAHPRVFDFSRRRFARNGRTGVKRFGEFFQDHAIVMHRGKVIRGFALVLGGCLGAIVEDEPLKCSQCDRGIAENFYRTSSTISRPIFHAESPARKPHALVDQTDGPTNELLEAEAPQPSGGLNVVAENSSAGAVLSVPSQARLRTAHQVANDQRQLAMPGRRKECDVQIAGVCSALTTWCSSRQAEGKILFKA